MSDPITGTSWDQWLLILWASLFPLALLTGIVVWAVTRIKK